MAVYQRLLASTAPRGTVLVCILVGWVFVSEGIQKFLFPDSLGTGRFAKIGIPDPAFTAPFVGRVEIVFGLLIIIGLLTRLAAIPLEARVDLSMLFDLLFLLIEGAGLISVDSLLSRGLESNRGPLNR